jgi:charged multivesicular body protein 3
MMQDTMEMGDEADLDEAADEEVEKVLFEMTDGLLGQAGPVGSDELKASPTGEAMKARLTALKSTVE